MSEESEVREVKTVNPFVGPPKNPPATVSLEPGVTALVDGHVVVGPAVVTIAYLRAKQAVEAGYAKAVAGLEGITRLVRKVPPAPVNPPPNLNEPDTPGGPRRFIGKTLGPHGVYQGESGVTFVGTVYLDQATMRREISGRHVECDPSTPLPAVAEKLFVARTNERGEQILHPAPAAQSG